jgi:Transglycosylase-like domain
MMNRIARMNGDSLRFKQSVWGIFALSVEIVPGDPQNCSVDRFQVHGPSARALPVASLFLSAFCVVTLCGLGLSNGASAEVPQSTWPSQVVDSDTGLPINGDAPVPTTLIQVTGPATTQKKKVARTTAKVPQTKPKAAVTKVTTATPASSVSVVRELPPTTTETANSKQAKQSSSTTSKSKPATTKAAVKAVPVGDPPPSTATPKGFDETITTVLAPDDVPNEIPDSVWLALRKCESGNNYAINTGNGYYGAYQFDSRTWKSMGYSGLPHRAAPPVQDEAAKRLQAKRGWGPWPACTRKLGLR